jgi:hypothetical protein
MSETDGDNHPIDHYDDDDDDEDFDEDDDDLAVDNEGLLIDWQNAKQSFNLLTNQFILDTLDEEERMGDGGNNDDDDDLDELELLEQEKDMSVEELKRRYYGR